MTIRQKVRISNIFMVLIPLLLTVIVIVICLKTSLGSYWYTLQAMYSDENGIQFAQSMIYNYQQELWENNWSEKAENENPHEIRQTDEMNKMEETLSRLGYHFYIEKNGYEVFSNLTNDDKYAATSVAGEAVAHAKTLSASSYDISVIKNTFHHGDYTFCVVAVHTGSTDKHAIAYIKRYLFLYILGFAVLFVGISVVTNAIMSGWISRSILVPLKKLHEGTKKIQEGNLEQELDYEKPDEFGAVCRDFNEMRAYLKESVEQRLEDEQKRKDLISGISHDLRTPLTSIRGYVEGLLDGIADTPEKREKYLRAIQIRTGNMVDMVNSLSEYNRLNSRGFRYHMENGNLKQFVEQYLEIYLLEARQKQVEIEFFAAEEVYPVLFDAGEWKRILDNLFTNTVRYRKKDCSRVRILLNQDQREGIVRFVFSDDGPGVPEESLERIFDSFYRTDESRKNAENGSGIGLAVVKEIVKGHGGSVTAQNQNGLAIKVELPLVRKGGKNG